MTVTVAGRALIDLGARSSVLDAVDRVAATPNADEVVLSIAAGAPVLRSPIFLEVVRRAAGARRIALVTPDARARSLAAAVHMPAFASVAALERHELDATEPLGPARRAAIVSTQAPVRTGASPVRRASVAGLVIGALLVALAIVGPSATVVVAPVAQPLGPIEYQVRAGPNNAAGEPDINATTLGPANITAKIGGTATGSRTEDTKATGIERFSNSTTSDIRIAKGTIVQTSDGVRFQTTKDEVLPHSSIGPLPPFVTFGTVDVAIEAVNPGTSGNVPTGRIVQSVPSSSSYSVTNPVATTGGDSKKFSVITLADYQLAASKADGELKKQADAQVATWTKNAAKDQTVYGVLVTTALVAPALAEMVNKDAANGTFELTATGTASAYSLPSSEPRTTIVKKLLIEAQKAGNDIVPSAANVEVVGTPTVDSDGVHFLVRGKASQFPPVDEAAIRAALVGRPLDVHEIQVVVEAHGVQFQRAFAWPNFWPRMPLLESRIQIQKEAPAASVPGTP